MLSWSDVEKKVDILAEKVVGDGYAVDTIIGVLRGGVIVANLLSDVLDVREVYVVGCRSYKGTEAGELKVYHDLVLGGLEGRNVLLVDDIADTGSTLDAAVEKLIKPRNPKKIKTATLFRKPWSKYCPTYCVDTTNGWVVFPWERFEAVKTIGKFFVETMGHDTAYEELSALFRLNRQQVVAALASPQRTY